MSSLEHIAIKHRTAKVPHGFMPIYESYFKKLKDKEITLVEIGVAEGASMRTWAEYFSNPKIFGLEKAEINIPAIRNVTILKCDAAEKDDTERSIGYYKEADIIIDDAAHRAEEQLASFKNLWGSLKPGGWYIIEDLFALYDPIWNDPLEPTIIDMIQSKIKSILVGGDSIQEVHWYGRNNINGIVFLRKRYEPYRIQSLEEFNV